MEIKPIIKDDFVVLDDEMTLAEMLGKLKTYEKRSGLVFRNNKYLGLVEKKWLMKSRLDPTTTKIKEYVVRTPIISEDVDLVEIAYLMHQSNIGYLPVEKDKKIIGVVSALDLVKFSLQLPEIKKLKVKDIKLLRSGKIKVDKDEAVASALAIMYWEKVDQVLVFEGGKLSGILSYRDLMRKYLNWSPRRDVSAKFNKLASTRGAAVDTPHLASLPVSSFSSNGDLLTIKSTEDLNKAINLMVGNNISDVIVMERGEPVGLLTVKNILRYLASLKVLQNFNLQFVGLSELHLDSEEKARIQKLVSNEAFKLQRRIHNQFHLTLHFKEYNKDNKEGTQRKYSVHIRVEYPGQTITISQEDWDIFTALHKTFENANNKLKSKFRGDSSHRKAYE